MKKLRLVNNGKTNMQEMTHLSINSKVSPKLQISQSKKVNQYFENSWRTFTQIPFPNKKDEAWRRTPIDGLVLETLYYIPSISKNNQISEILSARSGNGYSGQIKLDNGATEINVNSGLLDHGLILMDLKSAIDQYPDKICTMLGSIVPASDGKFAALSSALAVNGAILFVPQGIQVDLPIRISVNHPKPGTANFFHFIIWLEKNSKVSVLIEYLSPHGISSEQVLIGDVYEINVGEGAKLELYEIQAMGTQVWSFSHQRARISMDGEMNWIFGGFGSQLTKTFLDVDLVGIRANANVGGLFISDEEQHFDSNTRQNHLNAFTKSDLLIKGALRDKSRSVWQGMIHVADNAHGADGYQKSANIILSDTAKTSTIPGLEILNNDVKCSHGATISNLSPDELFYLQTRGIARDEGEKLLVRGFFNQIIEMIKNPGIRKIFEQMVDKKLDS